jgi:enoyl-CoA hydratase
VISLNRPRAIHALNLEMVQAMSRALLEWARDPGVAVVIIDHAVDPGGDPKLSRGFCAGVISPCCAVPRWRMGAGRRAPFSWRSIASTICSMPIRARWWPSWTASPWAAASGSASLRATAWPRRTHVLPCPIGHRPVPRCGRGWYLSRLSGRLGPWLALTGARLNGADCLWAGLASHHLPVGALAEAKARLIDGEAPGRVLGNLADEPTGAPVTAELIGILRHFSKPTLEAILASLASEDSDWARATLATLATKSPTTCKVALRQMAQSLRMFSFSQNMAMEYRIAARVVMLPDFAEGVRAVIVDKDNAPSGPPRRPKASPTR